jgi:hypothetical protein
MVNLLLGGVKHSKGPRIGRLGRIILTCAAIEEASAQAVLRPIRPFASERKRPLTLTLTLATAQFFHHSLAKSITLVFEGKPIQAARNYFSCKRQFTGSIF